jgi:GT2 family glycosyltransferase
MEFPKPSDHVAIVTLSKYSELFEGLNENLNKYINESYVDRILVRDGCLIGETNPGWLTIDGPEDFNFSANVNLGWDRVNGEDDIFFVSDDVRLTDYDSIKKLQMAAYADPNIGIVSPRILGPADNTAQTDPTSFITYTNRYIVFVCFYLKRDTWKRVGRMDEANFNGYGWDDVDYSRRIKNAGMRLAVTNNVEVKHGITRPGTETFLKSEKGLWKRLDRQNEYNAKVFFNKWGDNNKE